MRAVIWATAAVLSLGPVGMALAKTGSAEDALAIRALRATSNQAISDHDMARFTPVFADDAVFVWSNGTSAVGKAALQQFFARDFADPAFIRYVRTPARVTVAANGVRAVEHGTWTALKKNADGETRYGGDYAAHWMKTPQGWRVKGELYVKLRCSGSLCTP
jgi:uncharacterized protein (TIGR02246 family)